MSARDFVPIVQSLFEIPNVLSGPYCSRRFDAIIEISSLNEDSRLFEKLMLVSGTSGPFCKVYVLVDGKVRSEAYIDCGNEVTGLAFSANNNDDNPSISTMLWIASSALQLFCVPVHSLLIPGIYKVKDLSVWSTTLSDPVCRLFCFPNRLRLGVAISLEQHPHILVAMASTSDHSFVVKKKVEWECPALQGLDLVDATVTCVLFREREDFSMELQSSLSRRFLDLHEHSNHDFKGAILMGFTDGTVQISLMLKQQSGHSWTPARLMGWFPNSDPIVAILSPPERENAQNSVKNGSNCFVWFNLKGDVMIVHHHLELELLAAPSASPLSSRVLQSVSMVPGWFGDVRFFVATTTTTLEKEDCGRVSSYLFAVRSLVWSSSSRFDCFPLPYRQDLSHVVPVGFARASSPDQDLFMGSTTSGSLRCFSLTLDACQNFFCCPDQNVLVESQGPLHQYLRQHHHHESSSGLYSVVDHLERVYERQLQLQQSESALGQELQRLHGAQVALLQASQKRNVILRKGERCRSTVATLERNEAKEKSRVGDVNGDDDSLLVTSMHAYAEAQEYDNFTSTRVSKDGTDQTVNYHGTAISLSPCNYGESSISLPISERVGEMDEFHFFTSVVLTPPTREHSSACKLVYIRDADRIVYKA